MASAEGLCYSQLPQETFVIHIKVFCSCRLRKYKLKLTVKLHHSLPVSILTAIDLRLALERWRQWKSNELRLEKERATEGTENPEEPKAHIGAGELQCFPGGCRRWCGRRKAPLRGASESVKGAETAFLVAVRLTCGGSEAVRENMAECRHHENR